jgi:ABC-type glutathione transport system ATPase component
MSDNILDVQGLVKDFSVRRTDNPGRESFRAVDGISFTVAAGAALAIVGESGSGKSTTARMIVGLERATSGTIVGNGRDWDPRRRIGTAERRRRGAFVQMVFQDPYQSLDRRQRVNDCLDEALRLHTDLDRAARATRVDELLEQVRLSTDHAVALPRTLSGGERQRVAIARALAASPRLLILDEAVAALDVSIQAQILRLLARIRSETGVAMLFISHDLAVVKSLCDDILVMRHGKVVEEGPVGPILTAPQHPYTQELLASVPRRGWKPTRKRQPTTGISLPVAPKGQK